MKYQYRSDWLYSWFFNLYFFVSDSIFTVSFSNHWFKP